MVIRPNSTTNAVRYKYSLFLGGNVENNACICSSNFLLITSSPFAWTAPGDAITMAVDSAGVGRHSAGTMVMKHLHHLSGSMQVRPVRCKVPGKARPVLRAGALRIGRACPWKGFNSSPLGQNARDFADDVSKCIFVKEKFCILIRISLKYVPKGPIDNRAALVQVMAWCRIGNVIPIHWRIYATLEGGWVKTAGIFVAHRVQDSHSFDRLWYHYGNALRITASLSVDSPHKRVNNAHCVPVKTSQW